MVEISLLHLPLCVLLVILKNLSLNDIRNVMLTCRTLRNVLIYNCAVWKSVFPNILILDNPNREQILTWHDRYRISFNWQKGAFKKKIVIPLNANYLPWINYLQGEAILLSVGSNLRCYNLDKYGLPNSRDLLWEIQVPQVKRQDVRTNDISRFSFKNDIIACANKDGCVAIYKWNGKYNKPHLLNHIKDCHENGCVEVTAVGISNRYDLVTGNRNSSLLHYWTSSCKDCTDPDIDSSMQHSLDVSTSIDIPGHVGISSLSVNGENKIAIGLNKNRKPGIYDLVSHKMLSDVTSSLSWCDSVRDIVWHNESVVAYVTHSGKVQLMDLKSSEVIYTNHDPFMASLFCLSTNGDNAAIVGSSEYCRCVLYDLRVHSRHVQMYYTQKKRSPIYSLSFDASKLIAAADRSVATLNFDVNYARVQKLDYSQTMEIIHRSS